MSKQRLDKQVYNEVVMTEDGEVTSSKTVYKSISEPDFIKLYIGCVFTVKGVKKGFNPIFIAFLEYMSYADSDGDYGGQLIYVNKAMKNAIAKKTGLSVTSVNMAITDFVKKGLFKRVDVGTYQVNPNIVGRGDWKDIKNIRATFDFASKEIVADIVKNEEESMSNHQEMLEDKYMEMIEKELNRIEELKPPMEIPAATTA